MRIILLLCSLCLTATAFATTSFFKDATANELPSIAKILNQSSNAAALGYQVTEANYDALRRIFSQKLTDPELNFSELSLDEAKTLSQAQMTDLAKQCKSSLNALIYQDKVTFRYYFKDKNGILTSVVDISALTCEAMKSR